MGSTKSQRKRTTTRGRRESEHLESDSDVEDVEAIIAETAAQLRLTESALRRLKALMVVEGRFVSPNKYKELVATCLTNIKCLQTIQESIRHCNAKGEMEIDIPEEDFDAMEEIIEHWEDLKAVAVDQRAQAEAVQAFRLSIDDLEKSSNFDSIGKTTKFNFLGQKIIDREEEEEEEE